MIKRMNESGRWSFICCCCCYYCHYVVLDSTVAGSSLSVLRFLLATWYAMIVLTMDDRWLLVVAPL